MSWSWRPEWSRRLQRDVTLAAVGLVAAIVVSAGIAIATPGRAVIVVTLMLVSIGWFWTAEHRRFRATEVSVDATGLLRVGDGKQSASIDLASVDSVEVRLRTQSGASVLASTPRWTIEVAGPGTTLSHRIAHAAGLFNPERSDVERLEAQLVAAVEARTGRRVLQSETRSGGVENTTSHRSSNLAGTVGDRFEWRPPVSANADRNQRWFRIAYGGAALIVAVLGVVSAWGDWVGVILSALTVPGLILLCCGGLDWARTRNRRFRLVVDGARLSVGVGERRKEIALRGATVALDRHSHLVAAADTTARSTNWILAVTAADGTTLQQVMPRFGAATLEADYVALERELRRRS